MQLTRNITCLLLLTIHTLNPVALASVDRELAVRAIIGEAAGEGDAGMLAVAEAIRNRGTLKGVYGLQHYNKHRIPRITWQKARLAWEKSAHTNTVNGATHWDYAKPYWSRKMKLVATVGRHSFWK